MGKQRPLLAAAMSAAGIVGLYRWGVRPRMYNWGATAEEITAVLPGDELVEPGAPRTTRAVTIDAPPEAVWPWLAQIGEDRGGFYSYDWLERLAGAKIHNARAVHPEWQDLGVGDTVWMDGPALRAERQSGGRGGRAEVASGADVGGRLRPGAARREGVRLVGVLSAPAQRRHQAAGPRHRRDGRDHQLRHPALRDGTRDAARHPRPRRHAREQTQNRTTEGRIVRFCVYSA